VRAHVRLAGRVQGVGFRYATADEAERRQLTGWVRNLGSGGVEAVFEGSRPAVEDMVRWCGDGPRGAYVRHAGVEARVPAYPCQPVDLTGAGDMLAGAFLYGITHGVAPDRAARAACYLAMKVITQTGARLHHGTRAFWDEALASP
jgi:acylphosphatase